MQARSYEADRFVWLILITYEVKNPNLKQADILNWGYKIDLNSAKVKAEHLTDTVTQKHNRWTYSWA